MAKLKENSTVGGKEILDETHTADFEEHQEDFEEHKAEKASETELGHVKAETDEEGNLKVDNYFLYDKDELDNAFNDENKMDTITDAPLGMESTTQESISMDKVTDSEIAMDKVTDKEMPMDKVTNSEVAMDKVTDKEMPMDKITDKEMPMDKVADSEVAMDKVTDKEMPMDKMIEQLTEGMPGIKFFGSPHLVDTMWSKEMASEKFWDIGGLEFPSDWGEDDDGWKATFNFDNISKIKFERFKDEASGWSQIIKLDGESIWSNSDDNGEWEEVELDVSGYYGEKEIELLTDQEDDQVNIHVYDGGYALSFERSGASSIGSDTVGAFAKLRFE